MDHSEALRLQAAERYVLGELSPELREQYEEHYFTCEECASDVKASAVFAGGARALFEKESHIKIVEGRRPREWFGWLRPAIAAPALIGLLLVLVYQNVVMIPKLQREAAALATVQNADFVSLIGANSRGEGTKTFQIHRDRSAVLEIDIPATGEFANYLCQIREARGRTIYENHISGSEAKGAVHLILPKGALETGKYSLVILGEGSPPVTEGPRNELERLPFSVEVLP